MGGTSFVKRHALPLYFVLAYAIAWGGILIAVGPGNIPAPESRSSAALCGCFWRCWSGQALPE